MEAIDERFELSRQRLPGRDFRSVLTDMHQALRPRTYVEIGVAEGKSFRLVRSATRTIGIDPNPLLDQDELPVQHQIFQISSDQFFTDMDLKSELGATLDLGFIDGMHLFEFALRDFIQLERSATTQSTILIHDCYPYDRESSARNRTTMFWSGDTWKIVLCLKCYRPDLRVITLPAWPTGLTVVRDLDPTSTVLSERLAQLYSEFVPMDYAVLEENKDDSLNLVDSIDTGYQMLGLHSHN